MTRTVRRTLFALVAAVLALAGGVAAAAAPAPAGIHPMLTGIRTGLHPGYDRVVLDFTGPAGSASYQWGDELTGDPSGQVVWLTGEEFLTVAVHGASAYDDAGNRTYPGPDKFRTRDLHNVMAVALTGDFEGVLSVGLGTRHRSWVRIFTLTGPNRLVIDVGN